ncbi:Uncharacterised protein [Mycobacteroides abscessus]|nr:Uncharacterised protein [Mycobacteroides abscessus]
MVPERAGALRARGTVVGSVPDARAGDGAGRDVLEVAYDVRYAMADEVVGYGDAVLVLGPPDLREAVVRRLRDAAGLATGPADGAGQAEVERG